MILLKPGERYSDLNVLNKACKSVRGDDYIYLSYDPKTRKIRYISKRNNKEYTQIIHEHLKGSLSTQEKMDYFFEDFCKKAKEIHNNEYEYFGYKGYNHPLFVRSLKTGIVYKQRIHHILDGKKPQRERVKYTFDEFVEEARRVWSNKYEYSEYIDVSKPVKITDVKTGESFYHIARRHLNGSLPKHMALKSVSKTELDFCEIISSHYNGIDIVSNYRPKWLSRMEIDIFIPDFNIGIEFNGSMYHCSVSDNHSSFVKKIKPIDYHLNKCNICLKNGVKLIHIFDFNVIDPDFDLIGLIEKYRNNFVSFKEIQSIHKVNRYSYISGIKDDDLTVYVPEPIFTPLCRESD